MSEAYIRVEKWEDVSFGTRLADTILLAGDCFYDAMKSFYYWTKEITFPSSQILDLNYPITVEHDRITFASKEAGDEFIVEGQLIINHYRCLFQGAEKYPERVQRCKHEEFYKFLVDKGEIDAVWQLQDKDAAEIEKMFSGNEEYKQAKAIVQAALKPWKVDGKSYACFDFPKQ